MFLAMSDYLIFIDIECELIYERTDLILVLFTGKLTLFGTSGKWRLPCSFNFVSVWGPVFSWGFVKHVIFYVKRRDWVEKAASAGY